MQLAGANVQDNCVVRANYRKPDPGMVTDMQAALDMRKRDGKTGASIGYYPTQGK